MCLVLTGEAAGRAYVRYGNLHKAAALLNPLLGPVAGVAASGPLHQVMIRKPVAGLRWDQGDRAAWAAWIGQALTLAQAAALIHQVQGIVRAYGAVLVPILAEIHDPELRRVV